ncbi:hypothetical protein Tco_0560589 [Tanacetum coccineum]
MPAHHVSFRQLPKLQVAAKIQYEVAKELRWLANGRPPRGRRRRSEWQARSLRVFVVLGSVPEPFSPRKIGKYLHFSVCSSTETEEGLLERASVQLG